jgi:hypothetical protein
MEEACRYSDRPLVQLGATVDEKKERSDLVCVAIN